MRPIITIILVIFSTSAFADREIDIVKGKVSATPIAINEFATESALGTSYATKMQEGCIDLAPSSK